MKQAVAVCLWLAVGCSLLAAQQTLVASGPHTPLTFEESPYRVLHSAYAKISVQPPVVSADMAEIVSGFSPDATLYELVWQSMPNVCTAVIQTVSSSQSDYAFDRLQFRAAALRAAFTHENLVSMARNFVPGQPLPDAPSYVALTTKQKFDAFLRNSHSIGTTVGILSGALVSQATGAYPRFGGGMEGFGQRLGVSTAGVEGAAFIGGFVYPTLFHQDPRYFPSHQHSIINRLAYAASRALIGRSDNGMAVINTSVIASQFTEAAIANAYVPYRNETVSGTIENALTGLGGVAEGDILNEFWPDIKEFVFRHSHNSLVRRGMDLGDPSGQRAYRTASSSSAHQ